MKRVAVAMVLGAIATGAVAQAPSQVPIGAQRIQPEKGPEAQSKEVSGSTAAPESISSPSLGEKSQGKAEHAGGEGTEFWPTFYGLRLKITDTILALFTAGLFFATYALWLATRALVRGADKTAERQLRAYVSFDSVGLRFIGPIPLARATVITRNFGTTPAIRFTTHLHLSWRPYPLEKPIVVESRHDLGESPMMPGQKNITVCDVGFGDTPDHINRIISGNIAVYLLGNIVYEDTFGKVHSEEVTMIAVGERALTDSPFMFISRESIANPSRTRQN